MCVVPSRVDLAGDRLLRVAPQGFSESPDGKGRRRILRAYLPASAPGRMALAHLRRALKTLDEVKPLGAASPLHTRVVRDAEWANAWQAHARPIRIGRLFVQPTLIRRRTGQTSAVRHRAVVRLDPGMAFGSGEHASTRLCLQAIERFVRAGVTVIDLGTGSGILAIAAARLGAARVLAVDSDPVAVEVARANVLANRVARTVIVRRGEGLSRVRISADLIAANLTADILRPILSDVPRRLAPGGRFIASGFGTLRVSEMRRLMTRAGLTVTATERLNGWCAVHAARRR